LAKIGSFTVVILQKILPIFIHFDKGKSYHAAAARKKTYLVLLE